ncbi:MAG: bifunctional serine/threonine-protein kinase/formylglycine-generating enzyme family protein [Pirellulaceae bacterium]|nr:bifunctional serine/threonine-protein kinase/formylglycine-generating enzyme family protein [Pirellulaceae bacterium]
MIKIPLESDQWLEMDVLEQVDVICVAFEEAWQRGNTPKISDYALLISVDRRAELLRELIIVDKQCQEQRDAQTAKSTSMSSQATLTLNHGRQDTDIEFLDLEANNSAPGTAMELPTAFGDFILFEHLGRGAFGQVYRAENTRTGKQVAIKVPHSNLISEPDEYRLFIREARNVANLTHPGIVKVNDVEFVNKVPFLVLEYVDGKNLKEHIDEFGMLPVRSAVLLTIQLAEAAEHAHQAGVVHRDIKPSNILIESPKQNREAQDSPDLIPRLFDFGIAKRNGANTLVTQPGVVIGTPAYMSPEQACGNSRATTNRSDVYSMGVVLYELLTGSTPFQGTTTQILAAVQADEVPDIRHRNPALSKNLAIVCHQALRLVPEARYASAIDFANDLRRWLNGEPVLGRPIGFAEWAIKKTKKHRVEMRCAMIVAILFSVAGALAWRSQQSHRQLVADLLISDPQSHLGPRMPGSLEDWLINVPDSLADSQPLIAGIHSSPPEKLLKIGNALRQHKSRSVATLRQCLDSGNLDSVDQLKLACIYGVVDPEGFENLGVATRLTDWLFGSSCFDNVEGWTELTSHFSRPLVAPLTERYAASMHSSQRAIARKWLIGLLEREPIERTVEAMMLSRVDELIDWNRLLSRRFRNPLPAVQAKRRSLNLDFGYDEDGEARSMAYANLLLMEYGLGGEESIWPLLAIAKDPRPRTYFVHQIGQSGFPLTSIIDKLSDNSDPTVQYAILVAISQCAQERFSNKELQKIRTWLVEAYESHPNCGVHSMCRWLLNEWGLGSELIEVDRRLSKEGFVKGRNWYVNRLGMLMLVVDGPVETGMPHPSSSASLELPDTFEVRRITRSFAIGADEVTQGQFRQFDPSYSAAVVDPASTQLSNNDNLPAIGQEWTSNLQFLQWLSLNGGYSDTEAANWHQIDDKSVEIDYSKTGYRLPTYEEWMYCCMAMTESHCNYGTIYTPFNDKYVFQPQSKKSGNQKISPVGSRMPNTFGIFDTLGNANEWTASKFALDGTFPSDSLDLQIVNVRAACIICGTSSSSVRPTSVRVGFELPSKNYGKTGFRIARTLAPFETEP